MPALKWSPIADLPDDPKTLTDGELDALLRVWERQKADLAEQGPLEEFSKRLRREWAIETGIIENVYTLDRGVTQTLIRKGIEAALIPHGTTDKDPTLVARVIQNHYEALDGIFDFVAGRRQLSTGYVKELHAALLRNVENYTVVDQFGKVFEKPLEKGVYRRLPDNPTREDGSIHEYRPPEHVASEMDGLVRMHLKHEERGVPAEVEAAWVHHRFAQIHPFADGNGRVARALASMVLIKAGWFPLVIRRDGKARYIDSLEKADAGDLRPLVSIVAEAERNALIEASEAAYDVRPFVSTQEAVGAVRDRLLQRGKLTHKKWLTAKEIANQLGELAESRLGGIAGDLISEVGKFGKDFSFEVDVIQAGPRDRPSVKLNYVAEFSEYNRFVRLEMNTGRTDKLLISFHGIGPRFRGFIGVVAYLLIQGGLILFPSRTALSRSTTKRTSRPRGHASRPGWIASSSTA